jgi:dihydroorotase-like cyclic amidohydrolase
VDLAGHRTLTAETLRTKGKNTPFTGLSLRGVPRFTMMKEKLYDIEKDKWL